MTQLTDQNIDQIILHQCFTVKEWPWIRFICPHCDYEAWLFIPDGEQVEILGPQSRTTVGTVTHYSNV